MLVRLYYALKPVLPAPARLAARRFLANRVRRRCADTWPIKPGSQLPPPGWTGWPDGYQFALVLTHDVESPKGLERARQLAELEMSLGFRSSFNFIPEGSYRVTAGLRRWLVEHGFEVGVHDHRHDGKLYQSAHRFKASALRINHYLEEWQAVGFRSGFMLRNLDWLQSLDILYDASTFDTDPFEPQPDGASTIFPFWVEGRSGRGYAELPYSLPQDSTLFNVFREPNIDIWKRKLDWVAEHGGMALLNVHPDYTNFDGDPGATEFPIRFYREFLEYATQRYRGKYWAALPREVALRLKEQRQNLRELQQLSPRTAPASLDASRDGANASIPVSARGVESVPRLAAGRNGAPVDPDVRAAATLDFTGKRTAVVLFSHYPADPRPRRAAEALATQGMKVEMICLRQDNEPARETFNGVYIHRVPMNRRRGNALGYLLQYSTFTLTCFFILTLRCLSRRYHLVHVHNMPDFLVFSALIPRLLGARVILDLHDPMPELMMAISSLDRDSSKVRLLKFVEKLSIWFANRVVTVNEVCRSIFSSRSGPEGKIDVIMNTPDENIFRLREPSPAVAKRDPARPFVIMYHGSLVERHGLDLAVRAVEKVRATIPGVELRVYGRSTPYLEDVMAMVQQRGLQDVVKALGGRKLEEIVEAIQQCDLGVIPNRRSIFTEINTPTRIFEYLAIGRPVISPRAPGITDYFDEQSMLYFELGDADDLARRIEYAFLHPAEVHDIIRRGQAVYQSRKWSQEKLSFLAMVGRLLGVKAPRAAAL